VSRPAPKLAKLGELREPGGRAPSSLWSVRKHLTQDVDFYETGGILGLSESIKGRAGSRIRNDFSRVKHNNKERSFSLSHSLSDSQR
jgi:hypothetical protein